LAPDSLYGEGGIDAIPYLHLTLEFVTLGLKGQSV
jgi:hypothetical protein